MGLADRLFHTENGIPTGDIAIHSWTAAFSLYCYGDAPRSKLEAVFSLSAEDLAGLDTLKTAYDALSVTDKTNFLNKLESAGLFYESGDIDKTQYKQIMGL
jgi:hypothetical protein